MPSPFPGMDPYLEQPAFWSAFHSRLIVAIADAIEAELSPQYYVEVEMRVIVPVPEEIHERYLEIREVTTGEVITAVEVLSPKNKRTGKGQVVYEEKRQTVMGSLTHLVQIDLLRGEQPMAMSGIGATTDYRILVSRSHQRPVADLYGFGLRKTIPSFPMPLKKGEPDLIVALQDIFNGVYDRARYRRRIDYRQSLPPPPLSAADQQWVGALLAPLRGI